MNEIYVLTSSSYAPPTKTIYRGKITARTEKRISPRGNYMVSDIVIKNSTGYHLLSIIPPVGIQLYECIHTDYRRDRLNDITFEFTVIEENQRITGFKMHDVSEWIGDTLNREKQIKNKKINP